MATIPFYGSQLWLPPQFSAVTPNALTSAGYVTAATGDKLAYCGSFYNSSFATKSIRRVGFLLNAALVKAGGSGMTVSLQSIDGASTTGLRPDETQDQTYAIANINTESGFNASTWWWTGNLSADRSVAFGEQLAVVLEYDGGGRLGADSVGMASWTLVSASNRTNSVTVGKKASGTWAHVGCVPNVLFECSDGTYATLFGSCPASAVSIKTFKMDTGVADEWAASWVAPFSGTVNGIYAYISVTASTADFDLVLYEGTTALATVSVDANTVVGATNMPKDVTFGDIAITQGTTYYIAVKPTQTTQTVVAWAYTLPNASVDDLSWQGDDFGLTSRLDSGAWATIDPDQRLWAGVIVSSIETGAGGGANLPIGPGRVVRT